MSPTRLRSGAALLALLPLTHACGDDPSSSADVEPDVVSDVGDGDVDADADADAADVSDAPDVDEDATTDPDVEDADAGPEPTRCEPSVTVTPASRDVGPWDLNVGVDGSWSLTAPHGDEVFFAPATCREDGTSTVRVARGTPHVVNEFGAFRIELESNRADMEWFVVAGPPSVGTESANAVSLRYDVVGDDEDLKILFALDRTGNIRVQLEGAFDGGELVWSRATDEAMFGLGSQVTGMDLSGRTYPLWTQEQGNGKPENPLAFPLQNSPEAAYAPMGVWHSDAGWSAIVTHDAYSEIDLGDAEPERAALRSYAALPGFVLVEGDTPRARLSAITEYTGRLRYAPPPWTFGPWNDSVGGGERLREVADILRDNDVPSAAIWSEDWIGGSQTSTGYRLSYAWEWDPETYPDLVEDIAWLHDNGFAFLAYFNTFVPQPTRMYTEGVDGGYLMQTPEGEVRTVVDPAFRTTGLVDLTDAGARDWLGGYLDTAADTLGIDGWMADFTEWAPIDVALSDGTDPWHFHNRYPLVWQQANTAAMEAAHDDTNNWTYFVRSGWASTNGGSGGIIPVMWGGDQNTNWDYDDGFPTVIPISAHLGLSGVPVFGSDVAGYNALFGEATTKELFLRWSAMAAFHPVMRTHHGSNECANWSFDRDAETLDHYRRWARVHTMLYPVFRSLTDEARSSGLPVTRHPWLVAPEATHMWDDDQFQFFLGDDILVAPVLTQGAVTRGVDVPSEGWWPLFGTEPLSGSEPTLTLDAPPAAQPVLVRPGTILPLLVDGGLRLYDATPVTPEAFDAAIGGVRVALYPDASGALREAAGVGSTFTPSGDWSAAELSAATWNAAALEACADADDSDCYAAGVVRLTGSGTLAVGDASLAVSGPAEREYVVGIAGDAWGALGAPTTITELDPDIPPPCEEEE